MPKEFPVPAPETTPHPSGNAPRPIALLTDYGSTGGHVGALKAVILAVNPAATIFDITHDVSPQAVEEGAFVLSQVAPYLPDGAVCVAVVDPGVGTDRKAIALRTNRGDFVGPDNGLLSAALPDSDRPRSTGGLSNVRLPRNCEAVELANPDYFRHPVSATFHGRDIFAPVAGHLSLGTPLNAFGPSLDSVQSFPPWRASRQGDGSILGRIVLIDRFGNLVTNICVEDLSSNRVRAAIADKVIEGLQRTYQDGPDLVVYAGSSGFLEIGRRNGSAAAALGAMMGDAVRVAPLD